MGWEAITMDMQQGKTENTASAAMLQAERTSHKIFRVRDLRSERGIIKRKVE
jgi:hypothetical protein